MIIGFIVPNNAFVPFDFVKSVLSLPPRYSFFAKEGPSIPDNRNRVFEYAKRQNDDLLFIDSDIIFSPKDVEKIENHLKTLDCVSGVCVLGRPPFRPAIFGMRSTTTEDFHLIDPQDGVSMIGACGAGFLGISKKAIQLMPDNPFSNIWENGIQHGEDVSFCVRLAEEGLGLWCDSSINVGHIRIQHHYYGDRS